MAYTPPASNAVNFNFTGATYVPPSYNNIQLYVTNYNVPITFSIDGATERQLNYNTLGQVLFSGSLTGVVTFQTKSFGGNSVITPTVTSTYTLLDVPVNFFTTNGYIADNGNDVIFNEVRAGGAVAIMREAAPTFANTAVLQGASFTVGETYTLTSTAVMGGSYIVANPGNASFELTGTVTGGNIAMVAPNATFALTAGLERVNGINGIIPLFTTSIQLERVPSNFIDGILPVFTSTYSGGKANEIKGTFSFNTIGDYTGQKARTVGYGGSFKLTGQYEGAGKRSLSSAGTFPAMTGGHVINTASKFSGRLLEFTAQYSIDKGASVGGTFPAMVGIYDADPSGKISGRFNLIGTYRGETIAPNAIAATMPVLVGQYVADSRSVLSVVGTFPAPVSQYVATDISLTLVGIVPPMTMTATLATMHLVDMSGTIPAFNLKGFTTPNTQGVNSSFPPMRAIHVITRPNTVIF